ncbi:hypothetical protein A6A06_11800 [Streptomyces sp. CB02923]|uniref:hypothetical protein n=1 Tax=Streptomyces sp. CB02923 TaxID=1718985 RepID=UPI00093FDD8E|nr:hypothetical protein [Streptomyces sp. CB02923]OKI05294.1 hypothetical protein A6A06_11800 [Streptomyces sp. CB02923]
MSHPNESAGPDRSGAPDPSRSGFAETFAKGARTPKRGLAPGRRVWKTALGLPVLAGVGIGAVALATLGASQVRFDDGKEQAVAAQQPQLTKTGSPLPSAKPGKAPGEAPGAKKPGDAATPGGGEKSPSGTPTAPKKSPKPEIKKPAPPREAKVTYEGIAGPGCPTPPRGGYHQAGVHGEVGVGWYGLSGGSTRDGGCSGQFTSVPMSGDPKKDTDNNVMWWWEPGPQSRSCQVSVYVPSGPSERDVQGSPTHYQVLSDPFNGGTKVGDFAVDQVAHRGSWQSAGTFPVRQNKIGVKLMDRGDNHAPGRDRAHHGAGAVKVTCHD